MIEKRAKSKTGQTGRVLKVEGQRALVEWGIVPGTRQNEEAEKITGWHEAKDLEFFDEVLPDPEEEDA